jgi:hypothetical protein
VLLRVSTPVARRGTLKKPKKKDAGAFYALA